MAFYANEACSLSSVSEVTNTIFLAVIIVCENGLDKAGVCLARHLWRLISTTASRAGRGKVFVLFFMLIGFRSDFLWGVCLFVCHCVGVFLRVTFSCCVSYSFLFVVWTVCFSRSLVICLSVCLPISLFII